MNRPLAASVIVLFWLAAIPCRAEDQAAVEKKVKALIEQLASPNAEPDISSGDVKYPAGYDRKAQNRVFAAWRQLSDLGAQAFPYLLQNTGDKRYCLTADGGPSDANWSVGQACFDIVECHLQPYHPVLVFVGDNDPGNHDPRFHTRRPSYKDEYKLRDPKGAASWWEARKDKSLQELQIEALEWSIAEEAKTPKKYSESERSHLSGVLEKLRSAKDPLPATVPWSR